MFAEAKNKVDHDLDKHVYAVEQLRGFAQLHLERECF